MTGLRGLWLLCLLLVGCMGGTELDFESEGCGDEMRTINERYNRIEQWGNSHVFKPPWRDGQPLMLLQHKPLRDAQGRYCVPSSQSLVLSAPVDPGFELPGNWAFRWQLNVGGGGGSQVIKFDAVNLQQVALASENIDVSIVCEKANVDPSVPFVSPGQSVQAAVSFADGNVSSSQCTYTQIFDLNPGTPTQLSVAIPKMAVGFRVQGQIGLAGDPLVSTALYSVNGPGPWTISGDKLLAQAGSSDFMLLGGGAQSLLLTNTDGVHRMTGRLIWVLDI